MFANRLENLMPARFLLLVFLLFLVGRLPELSYYLRKGFTEFCQGLRWYRAGLDDHTIHWFYRILVVVLGVTLLGMLAVGILGL
jgi:hypothetical protein